jgi:hypothetical protein
MSLATDLELVTGLVTTELDQLWTVDSPELLTAAMWDVLPALVDEWALAASAVAAEAYDAERARQEIDGNFQAIVAPLGDLGTEALIGWSVAALDQPEPDLSLAKSRLVGGVQRRLANSANGTITGSTVADPQARGWYRVTRPDACNFCKMVASRGGVFKEATARFACHDHCYCRAAAAWRGRPVRVQKYTPSERAYRAEGNEAQLARQNAAARAWIAANLK